MEQALTVMLDNEPLRFTPDGKVSVIDAIKVASDSSRPDVLWDRLKERHPEILLHCEEYYFHKEETIPVIDSEGWGKIWVLLFDDMLSHG